MDKKKLNRKSYFCNDDVASYVKARSEEMGISESAFVNICIDAYMTQRMAINTMSRFDDVVKKLENLNNVNDVN